MEYDMEYDKGQPFTEIDGEHLLCTYNDWYDVSLELCRYLVPNNREKATAVYELTHHYYGIPWPLSLTGRIAGYVAVGSTLAIKLARSNTDKVIWEQNIDALRNFGSNQVLDNSNLYGSVTLRNVPYDCDGFIYVTLRNPGVIDSLPSPGSTINVLADVQYYPTQSTEVNGVGSHDLVLSYQDSIVESAYPNTRTRKKAGVIEVLDDW